MASSPVTHVLGHGAEDIFAACRAWRRWLILGWYDFRLQHHRTVIGPLWQTLQVAFWITGLALIFGTGFRRGVENYIPYMATGLIFWNILSSCLTAGPQVFLKNANLILNINGPLSLHIFREIVSILARSCFQLLVLVVVLPMFDIEMKITALWAIPGVLAILLTGVWVMIVGAIIGTRYRDFKHAVNSVMRFLFFASPIVWGPIPDTIRGTIALYNPIAHYLEVVRAPLLGEMPSVLAWTVVSVCTLAGYPLMLALFHRTRSSIVFWL